MSWLWKYREFDGSGDNVGERLAVWDSRLRKNDGFETKPRSWSGCYPGLWQVLLELFAYGRVVADGHGQLALRS